MRRSRRSLGRISALAIAALIGGMVADAPAHAVAGGTPASAGAYPFVAKLTIADIRSCTATLVDPLWVLTARNCFAQNGQPVAAGAPPQPTMVTIGGPNLGTAPVQALPVVEIQPHPQQDVLLARLAAPVGNIPTARLATSAAGGNETLIAAGYGRTATVWAPDALQTAPFTVNASDTTSVTVSGTTANGLASLCKGDAGAPMFRQNGTNVEIVAVGATSWQSGCLAVNETREGATATRVDNLAGWVAQFTEQPYVIQNVATGKCVDVPGYGGGYPGGLLYQYNCVPTSADNQLFFFDVRGRTSDGQLLYSIRNTKDNLCLDVYDFGPVPPSTNVSEYYCAGPEDNQYFRIVYRPGTGGSWLVNDKSGLCLDVEGIKSPNNDLHVGLYTCSENDDHIWTLGSPAGWTGQAPTTPHLIYNLATGKCADLPGYGGGYVGQQIYQYICVNGTGDNQLFYFDARGKTNDGQVLYAIRNTKDNLCADIAGVGTVPPGTVVRENTCAGPEDNQYFRVVPRLAGGNWLVNDKSGLCLDVSGIKLTTNDLQLEVYTCSDNDDHNWRLDSW